MTDDASEGDLRLERILDAPRARVWSMWTEPDAFAAWYGPTGATVPVAEMDLRVGGRRRTAMEMTTPDGVQRMWFAGEFVEVDEPSQLAYTESMTDEDGNPLGPAAPTVVVVELADTDAGTRLELTHRGVAADSPGAMGWNMALDKLEEHLAGG